MFKAGSEMETIMSPEGRGMRSVKPEPDIRDILILDRPEDIKLIYSEKYNQVLKLITKQEMSISEMARSLNINPGSVHYHLKELERHGLARLVREEVKGGIVKKFYRATAKRLLLDIPDFNVRGPIDSDPMHDYIGRLIRSIEYLGYVLPPENTEDARDLLHRYDNRMKALMLDMDGVGLENVEDNGIILKNATNLIMSIKIKNDPELARIHSEFEKLFLPYE
jgi:DNA-binding transcriptional ArsR family regulator